MRIVYGQPKMLCRAQGWLDNGWREKKKTPRPVGALVLLLILKIKEMALYDKRFFTSDFHLQKY